jgi:hypothetical protein
LSTQEYAIQAVTRGENVFISGAGGVGKSTCIKKITTKDTIVTSSSGLSALHIGGETTHSIFGLPTGLYTEKDENTISTAFRGLFKGTKIKRIIMDEISRTRADNLDLIDIKLRKVRGNDLPFGGIQVVVVGDLFQLAPIVNTSEKRIYRRLYASPWMFHSKVWETARFNTICLTKVYRQDNIEQINTLSIIREKKEGIGDAITKINTWCTSKKLDERLYLCSRNADSDKINDKFYKLNTNLEVRYSSYKMDIKEEGEKENDRTVTLIKNGDLLLKEGMRVIICNNDPDKEYKNGERGFVIGCSDKYVTVKKDDGVIVDVCHREESVYKYQMTIKGLSKQLVHEIKTMPIKAGYAISIDKAQGMTLDNIYIDLGDTPRFSSGLCYTGLSRAKDLKNVELSRQLTIEDVIVDKNVKKFYENL